MCNTSKGEAPGAMERYSPPGNSPTEAQLLVWTKVQKQFTGRKTFSTNGVEQVDVHRQELNWPNLTLYTKTNSP